MEPEKYLREVFLASDVYAIIFQHALTTERQEIMGLLIGEVDEEDCTSNILACFMLSRSDKQPDRVEISPEQLCTASSHAEHLAKKLDRPVRVLGWYHSHPHITVWPSHVDVNTQASYQLMDPFFVGLIASVFQHDPRQMTSEFQMTCFQARGQHPSCVRREVKLTLRPTSFKEYNLKEIIKLPSILINEEVESRDNKNEGAQDELTSLHNESLETMSRIHVVSTIMLPLCDALVEKRIEMQERIKFLESLKKRLLEED